MALDLSAEHIRKWRALMAAEVADSVGDDASPDGDSALAGLCAELAQEKTPRRYLVILDRHAAVIAGMGRARRLRLMAWVRNQSNPHTNIVRAMMNDVADSGGEEGGSGGGRSQIAPLFRREYEALMSVIRGRYLGSVQSRETVGALHAGIVEFGRSSDMSSTGM